MSHKTFFWLFALTLVVYCLGFPVTIMDVDSAQYASISREMAETNGFLQVMSHGRDYLDKPPLLFWVTALMFKTFGYANWSFKIGTFLFTLVGVYSTFRLGKLLYNASIGRMAAIILFSSQAFILINNDVRTDTILTASVVFAIWQIMQWLQANKWKWLVGAAIGVACAMMAKGPIGLMVPVLAVGSWIIGKKRYGDIFRWQYLVLLLMVAILLSPMLYGLYTQYDMQPHKTVGMITPTGIEKQQGVSGLKFYLWTQSFGRITGENVWQNNTGPFFFVHNFLWSFLPWALLFVVAFATRVLQFVKGLGPRGRLPELLTLGGFLLPFMALSMSAYKLPHYIFVVYPLAAILLASWWWQVWEERKIKVLKASLAMQMLLWVAMAAAIVLIHARIFAGGWGLGITALLILVVSLAFMLRYLRKPSNLIIGSVLLAIGVNVSMNGWFYPSLLQYQAGSTAALAVHELGINPEQVYQSGFHSFSYYYYRGQFNQRATPAQIKQKLQAGEEVYMVTNEKKREALATNFELENLHQFGSHSVTKLNWKFLNPKTRAETLQDIYILKIKDTKENLKFAPTKTDTP